MDAPHRFAAVSPNGFASEVRRDVHLHFERRGISQTANGAMYARTAVALLVAVVPYALLLSGVLAPWAALVACVGVGVGIAGLGLAVCHDAVHGAYSSRPWVNRVLGLLFDAIGGNGYFWKLTHNRIHHTWTNLHGLDEDVSVSPLLRLSPGAPWRPVHRYQRWFAWALYALATLNWIFVKDYDHLRRRRFGPFVDMKHPRWVVASVLGGKAFHYAWTLVIPILVLQPVWWQFLIGYLAMHLTAGTLLGVTFQLAHVVEETEHPAPPASGEAGDDWYVHQMRTTSDFARGNRWLTALVGGLNYQVEHHLFPRVCSIHYPAISPIVEACARRHGVPYHSHRTVAEALASHWRALGRLGRRPPGAEVPSFPGIGTTVRGPVPDTGLPQP